MIATKSASNRESKSPASACAVTHEPDSRTFLITTWHQAAGLLKAVRRNLQAAGSRTQPRIWNSGPTVSARRSRGVSLNLLTLEPLPAIPRTSGGGGDRDSRTHRRAIPDGCFLLGVLQLPVCGGGQSVFRNSSTARFSTSFSASGKRCPAALLPNLRVSK